MMQATEISTEHLIRALRVYATDLTDRHSPFNKRQDYLNDLAGWIACAATRLAQLSNATNHHHEGQTPGEGL